MNASANDVVGELFAAWIADDIPAMLERVHPEGEWRPSAYTAQTPVYRGREGVREWVEGLREVTLEIEIELQPIREVNGRVVVLGTVHEGEPGGPRLTNRVGWVCDVEGELVARAEGFTSWEAALAAAETDRSPHRITGG